MKQNQFIIKTNEELVNTPELTKVIYHLRYRPGVSRTLAALMLNCSEAEIDEQIESECLYTMGGTLPQLLPPAPHLTYHHPGGKNENFVTPESLQQYTELDPSALEEVFCGLDSVETYSPGGNSTVTTYHDGEQPITYAVFQDRMLVFRVSWAPITDMADLVRFEIYETGRGLLLFNIEKEIDSTGIADGGFMQICRVATTLSSLFASAPVHGTFTESDVVGWVN
jgi:hypothetical protein